MVRTLVVVLLAGVVLVSVPSVAEATPAVERAQRRLNQLGCEAGPADGDLGEHTRSAIIRIHRIPTRRSGAQIHPDWMVGTNLRRSHGCFRLPKAFSARLWDFGRIGTRVRVVR